MADSLQLFTLDSARRIQRVVKAWEADEGTTSARPTGRQHTPRGLLRAILLEDLPHEGQADAAVTVKTSSPQLQKLTLYGNASSGTFALSFKGQSTTTIAWNATAAKLQTALEALTTIGPKNVRVTLGAFTPEGATSPDAIGVWLIEFIGQFLTRDPATIPLLEIANNSVADVTALVAEATQWADTGQVETVHAVLPVGSPTPMRAGAVVLCLPLTDVGHCVVACEPRPFGNPY